VFPKSEVPPPNPPTVYGVGLEIANPVLVLGGFYPPKAQDCCPNELNPVLPNNGVVLLGGFPNEVLFPNIPDG